MGALPLADWPAADAAVRRAWSIAGEVEASIRGRSYLWSGGSQSTYLAALETLKRATQNWSTALEKLKHDPSRGAADDAARVAAWKALGAELDRQVRELDGSSAYGSLGGMVREVGAASVKDAADLAVAAGEGFAGLLKYAPWLIAAGVLLVAWRVGAKVGG